MVSNVSIVGAFMAVTAVYVILQTLEFVQLSSTTPQQPDSVPAAETSSIVQEKEQQEKVQNPDKISDKQKKQVLDFAVAGFAKCGEWEVLFVFLCRLLFVESLACLLTHSLFSFHLQIT